SSVVQPRFLAGKPAGYGLCGPIARPSSACHDCLAQVATKRMGSLIVFDLDGTLVDTAPDLIGSLNVVLARDRLAPITLDEGRGMIGGGVRRLIERGLALQNRTFTAAQVDELLADYVTHYAEHIADNSRPFPGVEAALDTLAARGNRFAVCTNKLAWLSVRLLDRLGLSARFVAICGRDTFAIGKPDPEILRRPIQAAGGALA